MKGEYWIYNDKDADEKFFMRVNEDQEIDLGDLSREAFSYLGEWNTATNQGGYGIAYRIGVKDGVTDDEGNPMELYLMFAKPIAKKGLKLTKEHIEELRADLRKIVTMAVQAWSMMHPNLNTVSTIAKPTDYMIKDLEKTLK